MTETLIAAGCFVLTVVFYYINKCMYVKQHKIWLMPLLATPMLLLAIVLLAGISYSEYIADTRWLMWLLGPATIAFALPIYDYRDMIRKHWLSISVGVLAGSAMSVVSSVWLARLLDLPLMLQKGLAVRSITTPFAMEAARSIGGPVDLSALFVVITGVAGMAMGETVLHLLPVIRSKLAHGAIFGAAAHGAGTAKAREMGDAQGVVACLVMMIAGFVTVLGAPLIAKLMF